MAVTEPQKRKSKDKPKASSAAARRIAVGANVVITIGLAFVVVCLINFFAKRYDYRRDLSRLGAYSLSDRTERIIERVTEPVRLTAVYTSEEPEKARSKYLPRVRDLFEEIALRSDLIDVDVVRTDEQKRELEKRVRDSFAAQATEHVDALNQAASLADDLTSTLQSQSALLAQLRDTGTWISRYSSFTNIIANLDEMVRGLNDTREEVDSLTKGETLPNYTEAEDKIRNINDQVKQVLEEAKQWLDQVNALVTDFGQDRITFLKDLPNRLDEMGRLVTALGQTIGAPGDEMPADPSAALKSYGQSAGELATFLAGLVAQLQDLADRHPAIVENPHWSVRVSLLGTLGARVDLPGQIRQEQQALAKLRTQISSLLQQKLEPNQVRVVIERVRNMTYDMQTSLKGAADELRLLPDDLATVDDATRQLLAGRQTTDSFADLITRIDELNTKLDALPEIESGTVGDTLKRDNNIVVEMGDKVKVVSFDDAWPIQYQDFSVPGRVTDVQRAFNGDSAVSSALLTMTEEKPVGAVIMVNFEPEVAPELRRFIRPYAGVYPTQYYSILKQKLEDAHFTVLEWNLAKEPKPPEFEEGLTPVYLVLPPVQYLVPQFVRQQGMQIAELDAPTKQHLYDAIGDNGRAIFLCTYSPPQSAMMGPFGSGPVSQPRYPYESYLEKNWGIDARNQWRVIEGIPDPRKPGYFGVSPESYAFMSINNFTTHPIGEPLRARRVPMYNVAPIERAKDIPEGVTIEDVLTVPPADNFWAAQNIEDVVRAVLSPESGGLIQKDLDPADGFMDLLPPFPVILAAENDEGGRIVVSGSAESTWDGYLNQPIPRRGAKDRISFDPPPKVNTDLVVNCAYWVCDREELIGAGPLVTPVLEPLEPRVKTTLSVIVTAWAFLALVVGAIVMFVRRK
jgi:hypothetical protein